MNGLMRQDLGADSREQLAIQCKEKLGYSHLASQALSSSTVACLRAVGISPFRQEDVAAYKTLRAWEANKFGLFCGVGLSAAVVLVPLVVALCIGNGHPLVFWLFLMLSLPVTVIWGTAFDWQSVGLAAYGKPVPIYVLELALQLRQELSAAGIKHEFLIEELVAFTKNDPFLVLVVDGRREYLEVWDEPSFGAGRTT